MSTPLTRRSLLGLSALSAGVLALAPLAASARPLRRSRPKRVVIGEGLAGLRAAREANDAP